LQRRSEARFSRNQAMNRKTEKDTPHAPARAAEIVREYGPFAGSDRIAGVTFDGHRVWAATGSALVAFDPESGEPTRTLACPCDAGTAFDGTYLYQIAEARIDKIDPVSGKVVASIPAPGHGSDSGMAWAEGSLWVGQHRDRKIHQIDPATGKVLRTIESNRFVTGVTWVDGELWHGTWEGDESELRRIDPASGAVLERLQMPSGIGVSGLESDGADLFYCGGGTSGKVRAVRRPKASGS
jgi:glutamine cyclotransferase